MVVFTWFARVRLDASRIAPRMVIPNRDPPCLSLPRIYRSFGGYCALEECQGTGPWQMGGVGQFYSLGFSPVQLSLLAAFGLVRTVGLCACFGAWRGDGAWTFGPAL